MNSRLISSCLLWPIEGGLELLFKLFIIVVTGFSVMKEPVDCGDWFPLRNESLLSETDTYLSSFEMSGYSLFSF